MSSLQLDLIEQGQALQITWETGEQSRYQAIWLRDNALDADSRSPDNGQRLFSILDVPPDTRLTSASLDEQGQVVVQVSPEQKNLCFPLDWLQKHAYDRNLKRDPGWIPEDICLWDNGLNTDIPVGDYHSIRSDHQALAAWLRQIKAYGFAKLTGVPVEPGALCDVVALFGYVRETNYGRYFDVRSQVNPINLAYTGLGLQAHTDNPYRDPVPTLQLLSCLENSTQGGDSMVVDGFQAVQRLLNESKEDFDLLSQHCARFRFDGGHDVALESVRPMIELGADGRLIGVRYNSRSIAPLVDIPYDRMPDYYRAYRRFAEILTSDEMQVTFRLQPGELFIVDNRRVLHSRKAFSGAGQRWLQGCYADVDGLYSTLAVIESQLEAP